MSHVFSSQDQDPGPQRLTPEEAKALIRNYQHREAALDGQVTVQDMAETLGLPTWQVAQMVGELRAKQQLPNAPMPAAEWLRTRLWIWALAALAVLAISRGGIFGRIFHVPNLPTGRSVFSRQDRINTDGIYDHDKVVLGRSLGMKAPAGFSFEIKYGAIDAAINGHSKHYVNIDDLSGSSLAIIQEEYANDIVDGFNKAISKLPPDWADGKTVAMFRPNYYDGGLADPIEITLPKEAFPVDVNSPAGKALHDEILKDLKDNWSDVN